MSVDAAEKVALNRDLRVANRGVLRLARVPKRLELFPPVLAAVAGLWAVSVPSFWRDESVSGMAASMPLGELWRLLGALDAVHALYYLLLRPFAAVSMSEQSLRLPSVIATAAAAYGVTVIGRRLASARTGLVAGAVYAVLPIVSRYAQEARSYAIVSAVAVLATWILLNALDDGRRARYAAYAGAVALLGWTHLYALLLVPAHGVTVLLWDRRALPRWAVAVAAAAVAVTPLVVIAAGQEQQVAWLKRPGFGDVLAFVLEVGGPWWAVALVSVLTVAGVVVTVWRARPLAKVAVPWAVLPVVLSFTISQVHPIYNARYVLFCVPGLALVVGGAFAANLAGVWVTRTVAGVAVAALAALPLPAQLFIRQPANRPDDLRSLAASLTAQERPGDGVLFVPRRYRLFVGVYARPYVTLRDLTFAPGHLEPRPAADFLAVSAGCPRIWMVSTSPGVSWREDERAQALLKDRRFRKSPTQAFGRVRITLFTRRTPGRKPAPGTPSTSHTPAPTAPAGR